MQYASKFGIYINAKENQVVRINSPYWFPEEPEWVSDHQLTDLDPGGQRHVAEHYGNGQRKGGFGRAGDHHLGDHPPARLGGCGTWPFGTSPLPN